MEDPAKEIATVASLVTAAINPEIQKASVLKYVVNLSIGVANQPCESRYYAPDISFRHPLCAVKSGPNSRDAILSILQWYRVMSPAISVHVNSVTYDEEKHTAFLDITQTFHIRWSPLNPAPAR